MDKAMIIELGQIILLGAVWGGIWAIFMQKTSVGWFISTKQTWLAVVLGCGGNLMILVWFMPLEQWLIIGAVFAGSSLPVALRSLYNQNHEIEQAGSDLWQQLEKSQANQG
jgi:hypothetical protein